MAEARKLTRWIRMPRGQVFRVTLGLVLLAIVIAIYAPHLAYNISTDAVINARVIPLVSPIEGVVTKAPPADGTAVRAGAVLAEIENRAVDRGRLRSLRAQAGSLRERVAARHQLNADLEEMRATLETVHAEYQAGSVARLEILLEQARAGADGSAAAAREAERDHARMADMAGSGAVSDNELDRAESRAAQARADAARARLDIERLTTELASVKRGIYVAEERNDVPYTQQRIDEIHIRRAEVAAQVREHTALLAEIEESIAVEETRVNERASVVLVAPRDGIVWRPRVIQGSRVVANSEVVRLIDCDDLFVSVRLHQRHFEDIRLGDTVSVRLVGNSDSQPALVRDLRGMGASEQDDRFAAPTPPIRSDEFLVTLQLDARRDWGRSSDYCGVGRSAEVRFDRHFDWFDAVAARLARLFSLDKTAAADQPSLP